MKKAVKILIVAVAIPILALYLFSFVLLYLVGGSYNGMEQAGDGTLYLLRKPFRKAAVETITYDPESDSNTIVIPDKYGKYPIKGLGGVYGRGAPGPFQIVLKGVHPTARITPQEGSFAWYAEQEGVEIKFVDLKLKIGPEIRKIYAEQEAYRSGDKLWVVRLYVECDPLNPAFYSEDGVLYTHDGKIVDGLYYWNQFETPTAWAQTS